MTRAKILKVGNSHAIQLPKEFKVKEKEFCIQKQGANIVLTPATNVVDELWKLLSKFSKSLLVKRNQPKTFDKRESINSP